MNFNPAIQSPNDMMIDSEDYVGVANEPETDEVAIINPDPADNETDQLQPLPSASDYEAMKEIVLSPLAEEPEILEDVVHTWSIEQWNAMSKKEHGPVFMAGGYPWRILLFPYGNNVDQCSIYLEHGFEPNQIPDNWSCCVQFGLVLWNPNDPTLFAPHHAHHRFTREESDWGFTRFVEIRKMFNVPWNGSNRPLCENEQANITAYLRVVKDETGVLWHNFNNYDSKKETGFVGLKNQGATCYLNSLLQSLYFTNAFRKAVYEIPTEDEESLSNSAYTLQRLFYQLQTSDSAVSTSELTKSFGWETRHIFEQQDVQELSRKLMERMEEKMKGTKAENILPQLFSGKIKTYISCINVDYESSRIEDFWDIQLNVSGNKNVLESFKDYIEVEKLVGENQYFAGNDYKLQDANKGVIFTSFPDVLHLQLKRFEYDIQRDAMMKINDRYEFPEVFDAAPFLTEDSDKSESWEYQLHGVLVHSGDLNAGHYYAFLKPNKEGWFYRYDDDKVTKATMREVLEENFGGEYHTPNMHRAPLQKRAPIMRQNSAYMLVYIRKSRVDKILCPVTQDDIPKHIEQRFIEETALKEAKRKEREEAHLYMHVKVVTEETFKHHGGMDLAVFDANPETDPSAPRPYRVLRATPMADFVAQVAADIGTDAKRVRLWVMVNRQNKTTRPDQPIMDIRHTLEETFQKTGTAHREAVFRVWAEVAEEVDSDGNAIWPTYPGSANGAAAKTDTILLLLKCFDAEAQSLKGVGHVYIGKDKKVEDLVPLIMKKMGWDEKLPPEDKILLWEEIKPLMIEALKAKITLKGAELQDGDIVCFQRVTERKADKPSAEKRLGVENGRRLVERFDDAKEYYDFLYHKKTVKFRPHPNRCDVDKYPEFDLTLSSKINYDILAERVGGYLGVPPTHLRFWTVNNATGNPKTAVKRVPNNSLSFILNPSGYTHMGTVQRPDSFFFEVLDISLTELDLKKNIKVTWLSEGITKEELFDLLVNKNGKIVDLIEILVKKAGIPDEEEGGRIRIFESTNNRFFRELKRDYPIINMNEYTNVYAERVPEDERDADEGHFIAAFHYQNEPNRMHGVPFKFLLKEGELFSETKKRLEKRTGFKGKSFEKIKFAVVRRAHFSKPLYLSDDDILWNTATSDDDLLGLDHADRSRGLRNGVDLFLR